MEKKSLGRGLDDISDIFLSTRENKEIRNGFSSKKLRDATCESCTHIINNSNNVSKCKIFTLKYKTYGVRYLDTISPTSGNYCEYFEPGIKGNADHSFAVNAISSDNAEIDCDIEESVIVRKSITFPDTPKAQQDILNTLSRYLEDNYSLRRIELRKTNKASRPGMKKCKEESVTIFIR